MDLSKARKRILPILGYTAFFVVLFVVFAVYTFPYERVRDYVLAQVNGNRGPGDYQELQLGTLTPSPLLGANLTDIEYRNFDSKVDDSPGVLRLDELSAHASLVGLITGNRAFTFSGNKGEGTIEGSYEMSGEDMHIEAELDHLDLAAIGLDSYLDFPLEGVATGTVELVLPKDPSTSNGSIELKVEGISLGDGEAKIKAPGMREGFTLERVNAGTLTMKIDVDDGTAHIRAFDTDGKDLTLKGSGNVKLAAPITRSRLNVALQFRFSDDYKNRDAKTKALFELMSFRPELKRATTSDGDLRFELRGFLGSPRAAPAGR